MKLTLNKSFILITLAVFTGLYIANVATYGIFGDGIIYATIAHNMHLGIGDLWQPIFTDYVMNDFHEHPGLAFKLHSFVYHIFGSSYWVDKIYGSILVVLNALIIIGIWNKVSSFKKPWWLPVLLWITIGKVIWSFNHNMLENTMCLFSLLACYVIIYQHIHKTRIWITWLIASCLLLMSFLSKGFPGLFPLAAYVALAVLLPKGQKLKATLVNSIGLLLVFSTVCFVFFGLHETAWESTLAYINTQVVESLAGNRAVVSRTWILQVLLNETLPILILLVLSYAIIYVKKWKSLLPNKPTQQWALCFVFLGFMASLPIIVSPKQLSFYLVPSTPYFAIAGALMMSAILEHLYEIATQKFTTIFKVFSIVLLSLAIVFCFINASNYLRNEKLIKDADVLGVYFQENNITDAMLAPSVHQDWTMMGYLKRYYGVSTDRSGQTYPYKLSLLTDSPDTNYTVIALPTRLYQLEKEK
jgi:hypothetical protein